ncbi:hypothetical protein [Mycobacterium gordonae]|uniref:Uncharacterized protein n=1 Tax=Mycobacterium gordonae TaxID=1778 RepID=A0A1X1WPD3_MYCGO|nr:hypothetical protein [Mycobacterium gordonae]MCV7004581.1 hypothetical protein [Mycobacterium gordonae]ODR16607.1 hypothetical protein BHQ23_29340 [Mycobacterium gordonae]ORV88506.1 hypothetical protein AWC08_22210 [Mycobacterium gordonae]
MSTLDELEQRVGEKFAVEAAKRVDPQWMLDIGQWTIGGHPDALVPNPGDIPQFPREQWVTYPNKRTMCLLILDRLLDFDNLDDEQWMQAAALMTFGGRERIA